MARDGGLSRLGVGSRSPAAWSAREIELQALATLAALAQISTPSAAHFLKSHQLLVQKFAADRNWQNPHSRSSLKRSSLKAMARDGGLSKLGVGSRSPAAWSSREIELQALASLAALAQISTPSAAHFLKSHQLLVQKFAADRNRQRSSLSIPFDNTAARKVMRARCRGLSKYPGGRTVARSIDARRRCS